MKYFLFTLLLSSPAFADICGKTDDRILSMEPRVGRLVKSGETAGCNITLIGNNCAITSGACDETDYAEFYVPYSLKGVAQPADEKNVYYVKERTASNRGIGSTWSVVKLAPNAITHKNAHDVQGFYKIKNKSSKNFIKIKVVSYGGVNNDSYPVSSGEVPPNSNPDQMNYAQQESRGDLVKAGIFLIPSIIEHNADTSYGSAGAPVIDEQLDELVGITTHGGCRAVYVNPIGARFTNSGTSILGNRKFLKAINSCLSK